MLLSILIPTYNRALFLKKNVLSLLSHIDSLSLNGLVDIIISNNCSVDSTDEIIHSILVSYDYGIQYYRQLENIGVEKNVLFTLAQAKSKYVMYLGDDDYLDVNYLSCVINFLNGNQNPSTVIPAFVYIDLKGNIIPNDGRDYMLKSTYLDSNVKNIISYSWRGHQLSGLVFKRSGLLETYISERVSNLYPFIFFLIESMKQGTTYHCTDFPVHVTQLDQVYKDWGYGKDGNITNVYDNYIKIPDMTYCQKVRLQVKFIRIQSGRLFIHSSNSGSKIFLAETIIFIIKHRNTLFLTKIFVPFFVVFIILKKLIKKIFSYINLI